MNRQRLWGFARTHWFDALIAVAACVGVVEMILNSGHKDGPRGPLWFDILAILGMTLPLFLRRRYPFGAIAATAVVFGASSFQDARLTPSSVVAVLTALASFALFGLLRDRTQSIAGLALGIGVTAIIAHNDPKGGPGNFAFASIFFTVAWSIGFGLGRKFAETERAKERLTRAERERVERALLAVTEERTRIARELHDVVGHSVSVMTVQASAARRLLRPHQVKEREALLVVEQTGREALAEMRKMVGVLRRPEEAPTLAPQPESRASGQADRAYGGARAAGRTPNRGRARAVAGGRRPHRLPARPGGPHERDQACAGATREGARAIWRGPRGADGD